MKAWKTKALIAIITTLSIAALALAGCGGGSNSASSSGGEESSSAASTAASSGDTVKLTNVSYDPTRELYAAYNQLFADYYKSKTGTAVEVTQSHGGSGSQARSVTEGAEADVVTLALAHDITLIEEAGLIQSGWEDEFEEQSSPYTSTIVFLVRKDNPKNIKDWDDLVKDGIDIIHPSPKSSGAACWGFLAAWQYASEQYNGDEEQMKQFVHDLYANVSVMDSGARGATTTFVENGQGDVLVSWENEALATVASYPGDYEIVTPSVSILAQPSVAIVDENAEKDGVTDVAKEYLEYLYSDDAQRIEAENGYRPSNETILKEYKDKFDLDINMCTIADFGGWDAAYDKFFNDGAIFDEIYES